MKSLPDNTATGPSEMDEAFTHGKSTNKSKKKKSPPTIIGGYCVNTGKYFVQVVKRADNSSIHAFVKDLFSGQAYKHIMTDGASHYNFLKNKFTYTFIDV